MIRFLVRLFAPFAVALLQQPQVRHALIRAVAEQESDEQAEREARHLQEQAIRGSWLSASNDLTSRP